MKKILCAVFALALTTPPLAAREERKQQIKIGPNANITENVIVQGNRQGQPDVTTHPNAKIGGNIIQLNLFGRPIENNIPSAGAFNSPTPIVKSSPSDIADNGSNVPDGCVKESPSLVGESRIKSNIVIPQIQGQKFQNPISLSNTFCPTGYKKETGSFVSPTTETPPLNYTKFETSFAPVYCLVKNSKVDGDMSRSCQITVAWGNATQIPNPYRYAQEFSNRTSLHCNSKENIDAATAQYLTSQTLEQNLGAARNCVIFSF